MASSFRSIVEACSASAEPPAAPTHASHILLSFKGFRFCATEGGRIRPSRGRQFPFPGHSDVEEVPRTLAGQSGLAVKIDLVNDATLPPAAG
jgi:hypothetical protein